MKRGLKMAAGAVAATILGAATMTTTGFAHDTSDRAGGGHRMMGSGMHGGKGMHRGGGMHGRMGMHRGMGMHGGGHRMAMFERLDANKDGTIGTDEGREVILKDLKTYDADGDGNLSLDEFAAMWAAHKRRSMVRRFQFHDTDGDGKVTSAEMTAPFEMMLKRMDRNRDGKIGPDDMHRRPAASAGGHHKGGGAPKK